MIYYPVIIPTLNRYEHFRRCVESLARNTFANQTELVIGLDFPPAAKYTEGYMQIKNYLPTIMGFKKVTIFERTENFGPVRNSGALVKYVYERYDAVIITEDDNEFSPCFLDYMNKMLNQYKSDLRISSVSAYLPSLFVNKSSVGLIFSIDTNGWGLGCWRDKYNSVNRMAMVREVLDSIVMSLKSFKTYPASFRMLIKMVSKNKIWGDVIWTQYNILQNMYQVRPRVSLVRNWGNDGSGVNCRVEKSIAQQPISEALTFEEPSSWEPYYSKEIAKATFRLTWPKNNLLFAGKLLITVFLYIKYRILHSKL